VLAAAAVAGPAVAGPAVAGPAVAGLVAGPAAGLAAEPAVGLAAGPAAELAAELVGLLPPAVAAEPVAAAGLAAAAGLEGVDGKQLSVSAEYPGDEDVSSVVDDADGDEGADELAGDEDEVGDEDDEDVGLYEGAFVHDEDLHDAAAVVADMTEEIQAGDVQHQHSGIGGLEKYRSQIVLDTRQSLPSGSGQKAEHSWASEEP
jgi:hypothetical protein